MVKIKSNFSPDEKIFSTKIKGITLSELKKFTSSTRGKLSDFWDKKRKKFFIPGVMIIGMFRYVVEKLHKEQTDFPISKIKAFYGSNGGTVENRVYLNEDLIHSIALRSILKGKYLFEIEVSREETKEIVLKGLFQIIPEKN